MSEEVKEEKKDEGPPEKEFYKMFKLLDYDGMVEGLRKEMSSQVGEMKRWKDYHLDGDPEGAVRYLTQEFDMIRKAINYRNLYSKRKKEVFFILQGQIEIASAKGDAKEVKRLLAERNLKTNEMMALIFRVYRIYFALKPNLIIVGDAEDGITEWEYEADA